MNTITNCPACGSLDQPSVIVPGEVTSLVICPDCRAEYEQDHELEPIETAARFRGYRKLKALTDEGYQ